MTIRKCLIFVFFVWVALLWGDSHALENTEEEPGITLTDEERAWLTSHPKIRVNGDEWAPFNMNKGPAGFEGISVDILNLAADRVGLEVEIVPGPWADLKEMLKNRGLDVGISLVKTPEREKYLTFTDTYVSMPNAIYVDRSTTDIHDIQDLNGKKVPIVKGFYLQEILANDYPDIEQVIVDSPLEGLQKVISGEADAYIGGLAVSQYLIQKNLISRLKIAGYWNEWPVDLHMGIRSDYKILAGIIQKSLHTITEGQKARITSKYITLPEAQTQRDNDGASKTPFENEEISLGRLIVYGVMVFIIISLLAFILIRLFRKEDAAVSFGSARFRLLILAGLSFFVILIILAGWFTLERNRRMHLQEVDGTLRSILSICEDRLDLWLKERTSYMKRLGRDPELAAITERLLRVTPEKDALLKSKALQDARAFFEKNKDIFHNIGFFIINPDDVSIGSMRDTNIGTRNLIAKQHPELLKKAFQGEVGFVPPILSDVHLDKTASQKKDKRPPTMFFMGPIRDTKGRIMAVMTLRVDPWRELARAMKPFGKFETCETYAFDVNGCLLSPSRFEAQLQRMGLLTENQRSALNIDIRDPGVDMVKGGHPELERAQQPLTRMASRAIRLKQQMDAAGKVKGHSQIESDVHGYRDYRGATVFGAWLWNQDLEVGLAAEMDETEGLSHYFHTRWIVFGILGFTLLLSVGAVLLVLVLGERTSRALMRARDNLEEKVAQRTAELRDNQERVAALLESVPDAIVVSSESGEILLVNSQTERLLGYERGEMLGNSVEMLVPEEKRGVHPDHRRRFIAEASKRSMGSRLELAAQAKDGTLIPVDVELSPLKSAEGIVVVASIRDITERKAADEAVRTSEERLRLILESVGEGIFGVDTDGKMMFMNSAASRLLGYEPEELIGKRVHEKIHHSHGDGSPYPVEICPMSKAFTHGATETINDEMLWRKDGSGFSVEYTATPVLQDGKITGAVITFRDITERKEVEEALSVEQERLQEILDTSPVGVAFSTKGEIHFANPRFKEMFGVGAGDSSPNLYVHPEERETLVQRLANEGKVENYELQMYNRDHQVRDILVSYLPITIDDEEEGILGWLLDITDRKKAEEGIKEKFEELTRFRRLAIGREKKMIELKKEINEFLRESGREAKYRIVTEQDSSPEGERTS